MVRPAVTEATPLTGRQRAALRYIASRLCLGFAPTLRELQVELGYAGPAGAHVLLKSLHLRGFVRYGKGAGQASRFRSITLVGARLVLAYEPGEAGERLREALEG